MSSRFRIQFIAVLVVLFAIVAAPMSGSAHASLVASDPLAGSDNYLDLAGCITVLSVRTDPKSEQSPAALETNYADDTRFRSKQIPSLR